MFKVPIKPNPPQNIKAFFSGRLNNDMKYRHFQWAWQLLTCKRHDKSQETRIFYNFECITCSIFMI